MKIEEIIESEFPLHPFTTIPSETNFHVLLSNYLAMSQAFPYLQAGSQKDLFLHYMKQNQNIPEPVEMTTVVGNFLCWDETGGLYLTLASGLKALPRLLETRRFHANLLKQDCANLLGEPIDPDYSPVTQSYLLELNRGLSDVAHDNRVAWMTSFEIHANNMITALWNTLATSFNIKKNKLSYFMTHVGGDDPAEPYHVEMTTTLINKIIPSDKMNIFIDKVKQAYSLHSNWCQDIVNLGNDQHYLKKVGTA